MYIYKRVCICGTHGGGDHVGPYFVIKLLFDLTTHQLLFVGCFYEGTMI